MRRCQVSFLVLCMVLTLGVVNASAQATDWRQIKIAPLHKFQPAIPKRIVLPNGLIVFLQEDHELPFIDGSIYIHGGSREEPANKTGMMDIYGEAWRTGGTKTNSGDEMDDFLEARAAKIETNFPNPASTRIDFSCLKENFDEVFALYKDLLLNPEFREDKIDIAKKGSFAEISRRNDEPMGIAFREARRLGYGPNTPYGRIAEYATVGAVTRQDLLDWHKNHVFANNMMLGVVGDFDSAAMEEKIRKAFGSLPQGPAYKTPEIALQPAKPGYYLVDKSDVNQSTVVMVEPGIQRDNPDFYAIQVFNEAFGGSFSSRLFSDVRSKRGLAYAVSGRIGDSWDHQGLVLLFVGTKSESTIEGIQAMYENVEGLAKNPLTEEEIQRAKDALLNSFIFQLDAPEKVLRERMAANFFGYPLDLLEKYQPEIQKVTAADVARVAAKYLHKDKLAVMVLGNTAEFDKPLTSLGTVTKLDITIPPQPDERKPGN